MCPLCNQYPPQVRCFFGLDASYPHPFPGHWPVSVDAVGYHTHSATSSGFSISHRFLHATDCASRKCPCVGQAVLPEPPGQPTPMRACQRAQGSVQMSIMLPKKAAAGARLRARCNHLFHNHARRRRPPCRSFADPATRIAPSSVKDGRGVDVHADAGRRRVRRQSGWYSSARFPMTEAAGVYVL